ncbi:MULTISPECIES: TusE/DsrC/DsvC family sulfur relay protein [unclassified Halomonas]|uniref:TusE/DsrC/DsvC family sulfur relay protein n=1 Tax=unclassified Halomonas TaxID=2609666 RepID=UPI002885991C|nr:MULTISPECIES: TusE/DsrC/DsvC family sulfur relay protein [unclassified Halomonas]MDT0499868.1 TusE/DsrC/DsvC family sulfur relay protein [Halomonas sp. PAR7]MDT0510315.1 TusE/DsrC/DsvC family sulfur relay protein [Halomonas sp. LES1]MDT0589976.1 TusE/DsrC/DsvC family sulfur relay protein [Halomonas sp. PAR8]
MASTEIYRYLPVNDQDIPLDPEGYLVNMNEWSTDVCERLAEEEGIALTVDHWEVIHVLRDFYDRFEQAPAMRPLVKAVGQALGPDKGRSIYLMKLFPGSPAKVGARLAGLPKPANCL